MSKYVNEELARHAADFGTIVGETEPCRETKYSFWRVYSFDGTLTACVCDDDNGIICGEQISIDELNMYVDDVDAAMEKIRHLQLKN